MAAANGAMHPLFARHLQQPSVGQQADVPVQGGLGTSGSRAHRSDVVRVRPPDMACTMRSRAGCMSRSSVSTRARLVIAAHAGRLPARRRISSASAARSATRSVAGRTAGIRSIASLAHTGTTAMSAPERPGCTPAGSGVCGEFVLPVPPAVKERVRKVGRVPAGHGAPRAMSSTRLRSVSSPPPSMIALVTAGGTRASRLAWNLVPMSAPAAPSASAAATPRPSAIPRRPAPASGAARSATAGTNGSVIARRPPWPPASPPCATMTSAPTSSARRASSRW